MSDDDSTNYYAATRRPNKAFPVRVPGPNATNAGDIDPREAADNIVFVIYARVHNTSNERSPSIS